MSILLFFGTVGHEEVRSGAFVLCDFFNIGGNTLYYVQYMYIHIYFWMDGPKTRVYIHSIIWVDFHFIIILFYILIKYDWRYRYNIYIHITYRSPRFSVFLRRLNKKKVSQQSIEINISTRYGYRYNILYKYCSFYIHACRYLIFITSVEPRKIFFLFR